MLTGVKYCGGCREHYDRRAAANRIKGAFSATNVVFEGAENDGSYDVLLVICGCGVKCAEITGYQARKTVMVDGEECIEKAIGVLKEELS